MCLIWFPFAKFVRASVLEWLIVYLQLKKISNTGVGSHTIAIYHSNQTVDEFCSASAIDKNIPIKRFEARAKFWDTDISSGRKSFSNDLKIFWTPLQIFRDEFLLVSEWFYWKRNFHERELIKDGRPHLSAYNFTLTGSMLICAWRPTSFDLRCNLWPLRRYGY